MKKVIFLAIALVLTYYGLNAQDNFFYGPDGNKVYFNVSHNIKYVKFVTGLQQDHKSMAINNLNSLSTSIKDLGNDTYLFTLDSLKVSQFQSTINNMPEVEYCSSLISSITDTSYKSWTKNKIFVELVQGINIEDLLINLDIANTAVIQWSTHSPSYIVTLPKDVNPIDIANLIYGSGLVNYSIPVFCIENPGQNTDYSQQWGLENTGQQGGTQGVDINVLPAWNLSTGSGIIVAIIDNGVELDHPDLQENIIEGYGSVDGYPDGSNGGKASSYHGTICAGIVAAVDNSFGVKGVAYDSKIMPVKVGDGIELELDKLVLGIEYAYEHNADVLNCSFGVRFHEDSLPLASMCAPIAALYDARLYGRGGKGCVVVCASGNSNDNFVHIPASRNGNLSVGAIDRCGIRAGGEHALKPWEHSAQCEPWGSHSAYNASCYGNKLHVVAPGTSCRTTTVNGGYASFNGTSLACPHVSGVAALILAANPGLTESEVRELICSNTTKVNSQLYTYADHADHPFGTWNRFLGYGLVNAHASVSAAVEYDLYIRDSYADDGSEPNSATYSSMTFNSPDIWYRRSPDGDTVNQGILLGSMNYIYVRVHNRGRVSSSTNDYIKLYDGRKGCHFGGWPALWDQVGYQPLPSIPAGGSVVLCFPRYYSYASPYQKQSYPLLAEIVSENDPSYGVNNNAGFYAYNSNNIAIDYVTKAWQLIVNGTPTALAAGNYVSNYSSNGACCSIIIKSHKNSNGNRLIDRAKVCAILSEELKQCVVSSSQFSIQGGFFFDDSTIVITDSVAVLSDIFLPSNHSSLLTVQANYLTEAGSADEVYSLSFTETLPDGFLLGGSVVEFSQNERELFYANAGENIITQRNHTVMLRAEGIGEPATYRWFNTNGNLVSNGQEFTFIATNPVSYQLEVTADADGYRDYDTVSIAMVPSQITAIVPNPASQNIVTVQYNLSDSSTAQLLIMNAYLTSDTPVSVPLMPGSTQSIVDISNYPQGVYTVTLVVNGIVTDSKNFIRVR